MSSSDVSFFNSRFLGKEKCVRLRARGSTQAEMLQNKAKSVLESQLKHVFVGNDVIFLKRSI